MEALSTITPTALYASIPFVVAFVGGFGYWITGIARQIMQAENFKR